MHSAMKKVYKWICTVLTHIVQGLHVCVFVIMKFINSMNINGKNNIRKEKIGSQYDMR